MSNRVHLILLIIGIGLRVTYYLHADMLNLSEMFYAENILARSYREIFFHLQILPDQPLNALGFYLVEKGVSQIFGASPFALRLYPLICSLGGLLLFYYLSRCYLSAVGASMALAFFALSEWLVVTAGLVSPYAADVLTGLLALFVFEQARRLEFRPKAMIALAVIGAVSMWFSYSGILVWLAVLICLTDQIITLRYVRRITSLMGIISVWFVSFISLYLVCLSHLVQSPYTWHRWQVAFSPAPYWSWDTLYWTVEALLQFFEHPVDFAFPLVGVIFYLAGAAGLVKRDPDHAVLLILPVLLTYLLAGFRMYPAFGQAVIFLLPFGYLLIAAGLAWTQHRFHRPGLWVGLIIFACLLIQPLTHLTDAMAAVVQRPVEDRQVSLSEQGSIVMLGDSLFALNDWAGYFGTPAVRNMGVVGDKIGDVRARAGQLLERPPAKIFVLVGINDHPDNENIDDLIRQYRRLILELQRAAPQSRIFVSTLLPVNPAMMSRYFSVTLDNAAIRRFNRALRRVAAERGVSLIDSYRALAVEGELNPAWTSDGVHLNREGYRQWRPLFMKHIRLQ